MLSNKICKKILLCVGALFCALFPIDEAEASSLWDAASTFLKGLNLPEAVWQELSNSIKTARSLEEVIYVPGRGVYSFSAGKPADDNDTDVKHELEIAESNLQTLRARRSLMVHLLRKRVDQERYPNEKALKHALYGQVQDGSIAGLQSVSEIVDGWVFSLVWLDASAKAIQEAVPQEKKLNDDYCSYLYAKAKTFFDGKQYENALPIFKHIHDLHWADIALYLDAAECFQKMGNEGEALLLLKELTDELGERMSSDEWTRTGGLFRICGDKAAALSAFQIARKRFREGR